MATIKAGNIRKGMYLLFKNQPHLVTKTDFMSPGKGSAFMRVRLKNIKSLSTQEFTYKSNESVEELEITSQKVQYLYTDADSVVFMNPQTYDQFEVPRDLMEDKIDLMLPELEVYVMSFDEQVIGVSLPPKIRMKVTEAHDATAGNTVGQAKKEVVMESGLKVMAPLFVKTGDILLIDTDSKQYVSRG